MATPVYLDYNASAPVRPEVIDLVAQVLAETGNASSVHSFGRDSRRRLEVARESVAALVGARPEQVIFTSGGTEANNLALTGSGRRYLLVSAGEHPSVLRARPDAISIPLRPDGQVDVAALGDLLAAAPEPALVSVMAANNETGVIQPLAQVIALARVAGARVHCDGVQAAGKIPLDFASQGLDYLSLSGHKLGAPQGVGALVVAEGVALAPALGGGGQERSRRAGTENLPGIAGFGAAAALATRELATFGRLADLRDDLERRLRSVAPELEVFGQTAPRLANTSCFALAGLAAETQVMALDLEGVAVSAGSACSSGKVEPSHVLEAMGATPDLASAAIRVSLGWQSEPGHIERLLEAWRALYNRWAGRSVERSPAA